MFVLTDAEERVKGSGRSIDGYHMYEELNKCKELLTKFGGHRLAAGLSLPKENVGKFREMLNKNCTLTEEEMKEKVTIDMEMPFGCVTEGLVKELELLEPFGKGNTKPVFAARDVTLLGARILGKNRNVLKLQVQDDIRMQAELEAKKQKEQMPKKISDRIPWAKEQSEEYNAQIKKNKAKYRGMEL